MVWRACTALQPAGQAPASASDAIVIHVDMPRRAHGEASAKVDETDLEA